MIPRLSALLDRTCVDIQGSMYHCITCERRFLWTTMFSRRRRPWRPRRERSWGRSSRSSRVAVCGSRQRLRVRVGCRFSKSQWMPRLSRVIARKSSSPKTRREARAPRHQCSPRARLAEPSTPCQCSPVVSRRSATRVGDLWPHSAWLCEAFLEPGLHAGGGPSARGRVASTRTALSQAAPLLAITGGSQARDLPSDARPSAGERRLSHRGGTATAWSLDHTRCQTVSACGR